MSREATKKTNLEENDLSHYILLDLYIYENTTSKKLE